MAVLTQIGGAVTSVGDSNPYALAIILGLVIPVTGMTPLSSMVLTSLLGLTGIPMAIGALTCTGSSFVNYVLFSRLNIGGSKSKAFAVFVEPLTQIDLIAKYPLQLYGTNAIIGVVNACIVTFSGLVIGVKGMATPIGAIVLFGFNDATKSIITIIVVAVVSVVLAFIFSTLIKNST